MKNKINEASIKIDVNGLESDDFETLSRMLALAGQAESQPGMNPGFSDLPKMEPFDFDGVMGDAGETQPIMNPDDAMSQDDPLGGDVGLGDELGGFDAPGDDLGAAVDDLAGTVTDFGADSEEDDVSLDLDGQPSLELGQEDEFAGDDEFDMDRMSSLAGLGESISLSTDEEAAANDEMEDEASLESDEETAGEDELSESLLPDLSLDEDANASNLDSAHGPYRSEGGARDDAEAAVGGDFIIIPARDGYYWKQKEADTSSAHGPYQSEAGARDDAESKTGSLDFMVFRRPDGYYWDKNSHNQTVSESEHRDFGDDHHAVDSKEHGPFRTEREAVHDAMRVTNGTQFEHFAIIPGKDGYYWRRNLQEEYGNEPDPSMVDMDGIENSRHAFKKQPGTALGDNPLNITEDEDVMYKDARGYSIMRHPDGSWTHSGSGETLSPEQAQPYEARYQKEHGSRGSEQGGAENPEVMYKDSRGYSIMRMSDGSWVNAGTSETLSPEQAQQYEARYQQEHGGNDSSSDEVMYKDSRGYSIMRSPDGSWVNSATGETLNPQQAQQYEARYQKERGISESEDEDESVEEILESINAKFAAYMKGL